MYDYATRLNEVMRPVSPPRVIEDVYTDDQHARLVDVIQRNGPWPIIAAHHFESFEEVIATTTGVLSDAGGMTLDDIAAANFRGFLAENGVVYHPELEDCFHNPKFLALARDYWGLPYARPTMMLFNLCGPHHTGVMAHVDAVTFRGMRFENTPVWLLNVMGKSGLFTDYLVKMAQVITWWYLGENGTFTYWPDGPFGDPKRLDHPLWNKGVVVQNEAMFHRGDPVGSREERDVPGLKHRSRLGYDPERGDWAITTDGEVIRRYRPEQMRLLVHWNAEVYADRDEVHKQMDGSDELTLGLVVDRLLADLRANGLDVASPADPLHDQDWVRALTNTYTIAPTTDWIRRRTG
jgi:hypothetical protein